jgi:hypothetical protein
MTSNARRLFCAAAFASALMAAPSAEAGLLQRIQFLQSSSMPMIGNYQSSVFQNRAFIGPGKRTLLAYRSYAYDHYISFVLRRPVSAFCRFFC